MNEQLEVRLRTSADYGNITRMAGSLAERAARQRPSAMLEFAVMDTRWRSLELLARQAGYDVFAAWEDVSVLADQLAVQLHWLSASYEGHAQREGDVFHDVAVRDVEELRVKNANYGESWKRRGGAGAFMMLARKWDRLDNLLAHSGGGASLDHLLAKNPGNVLDDVGDLRRYLLLVADEAPRWAAARPEEPRELRAGSAVLVYDAYRFAVPLAAELLEVNEKHNNARVRLRATNNTSYPVDSEVWVHPQQLRPAPVREEDSAAEPGPSYVDQDRP